MTILEDNTWTGLNITEVRPYKPRIRMLQQLQEIAKDQAYAYKAGLGYAVPNAPGSAVAANHVHDGTNGAVIPIPYCQAVLGASMPPDATTGDWQPLCRQVFWNQPGVTTVRVYVWTTNAFNLLAGGFRGSIRSASAGLPVAWAAGTWRNAPEATVGSLFALKQDMTVTADSLNVLMLEAWNGAYTQSGGTTMPTRDLVAFSIVPWLGEPLPGTAWQDSSVTTGQVKLPSTTYHHGAREFSSFDSGMFADGRAVSSYLVQSLTYNDGLLWERLTGRPAPLNVDGHTNSAHYDGHAHKGDTTSATSSNTGAEMDQPLGAWHYGVGCRPTGVSGYLTVDQPSASDDAWSGRIYAPTVDQTSGNTYGIVSEHPVRLPAGQAATYANATGKLRFAAVVYYDNSKAGRATVRGTMLDSSGASPGTSNAAETPASGLGWTVVTGSGLDGSGSTTGEEIQLFRVELKQATTSTGETTAIASSCLWLER